LNRLNHLVSLPPASVEAPQASPSDDTSDFSGMALVPLRRRQSYGGRAVQRVFELTYMPATTGLVHNFRQTFPTDLLIEGVPIEDWRRCSKIQSGARNDTAISEERCEID
jgi:hypothetical protein